MSEFKSTKTRNHNCGKYASAFPRACARDTTLDQLMMTNSPFSNKEVDPAVKTENQCFLKARNLRSRAHVTSLFATQEVTKLLQTGAVSVCEPNTSSDTEMFYWKTGDDT
jgi:hypothetical protein